MRNGGRHILTEATWFHRWSSSTRTGPFTLMDLSLEHQLCFQAWLQSGLLLLSSLVVVAVFSELVSACGVAGVTSHSSGSDGTFDFSGEVTFAQWRDSHPDRSNLVLSMDLSLEYQFRVQARLHLLTEATVSPPFWLASLIVTRRCDRLFGARNCFLTSQA